jgi:hypothetical protein
MSQIGYYRYKLDNLNANTITPIVFKVNGTTVCTKYINTKEFCTGEKLIKFLDKNGQYRFYPFNKYYQTVNNPTSLGKTNKLIESILNSQSDSRDVGSNNERRMLLTSKDTNQEEFEKLIEIYLSPRIYLYVGSGTTDEDKDWILVTIANSDNIVRQRKVQGGEISIEIILPEWYTIKMI